MSSRLSKRHCGPPAPAGRDGRGPSEKSRDLHFRRLQHELVAPSGGAASLSSFTRQPGWLIWPVNGGSPVTLPTTRIADGSKPFGTVVLSPSFPGRTGSISACCLSRLRLLVNLADRLADLGVIRALNVFHQEVHQPGLGLKEREHSQRRAAGLRGLRRLDRLDLGPRDDRLELRGKGLVFSACREQCDELADTPAPRAIY